MPCRMDQRQSLGKRGEDLACAELEKRGYVIVDRRFRTRCGELDIVARDGGVLVFVEVKARSGSNFGTPVRVGDVEETATPQPDGGVILVRQAAQRRGVPV